MCWRRTFPWTCTHILMRLRDLPSAFGAAYRLEAKNLVLMCLRSGNCFTFLLLCARSINFGIISKITKFLQVVSCSPSRPRNFFPFFFWRGIEIVWNCFLCERCSLAQHLSGWQRKKIVKQDAFPSTHRGVSSGRHLCNMKVESKQKKSSFRWRVERARRCLGIFFLSFGNFLLAPPSTNKTTSIFHEFNCWVICGSQETKQMNSSELFIGAKGKIDVFLHRVAFYFCRIRVGGSGKSSLHR